MTKDEQKQVRKNLREYSRVFDQEDADRGASADLAVVEARRRMLEEWYAWRSDVEVEVHEDRAALGLPQDPHTEMLAAKTKSIQGSSDEQDQVIEEIVEDVLEESEEILA